MRLNKIFISSIIYGGVLLEIFFSYFMYLTIDESFEALSENYNFDSRATSRIFISISIILAIANLLEDVISINPVEEIYDLTHNQNTDLNSIEDENTLNPTTSFCLNYPLKAFSLINAYTSFITLAATDSIPIVTFLSIKYIKWPVSIIPVILGTAYYHMLVYKDTIKHHEQIYTPLLTSTFSVFLNIIKNPLLSLEVIMNVGANVILRSGLYSYSLILLIKNEEFIKNFDSNLYPYIMLFVTITTGYSTIFSRFLDTQREYFLSPSENNYILSKNDIALSNIFKNAALPSVLRIIRTGGTCFLLYKHLPTSLLAKVFLTSLVGVSMGAHGFYISYRQAFNHIIRDSLKQSSVGEDNNVVNNNKLSVVATAINISTKLAFTFSLLGAFTQINNSLNSSNIHTDLNFNDILILVATLSIPVNLNNFDYYNVKLNEMLEYYNKKYNIEKTNPKFGKFCCFFHSIKEYGISTAHQKDEGQDKELLPSNESLPLLPRNK